MNNTISVIIPVYNVEAYLSECLDSVLSQSYSDLQVILIDDGSTDSSGTICDEYAARDGRILVIHQKNGGAAAAKNAGLRAATGHYLSFVDSDDYLEPGAYAHMIDLMKNANAEVVQCRYRDVFQNRCADWGHTSGHKQFDTHSYIKLYADDWTCGLLWDKLYVRALFDGVRFEEGHRIDDEYFTYQGIMNAKTIVRDDRVIYNYRKRRSSVMQSPESGRRILLDRIDYVSKRRRNVLSRFPSLRPDFDRHFLEMMVILFRDPMADREIVVRIRKELRCYLREKQHTPADVRLWPALLQIGMGIRRKSIQPPANKQETNLLFD